MASFVRHQLKFSRNLDAYTTWLGWIFISVSLLGKVSILCWQLFISPMFLPSYLHMIFIKSHQTELKKRLINSNFLSLPFKLHITLYLNSLWLGEGEGGCWWWHCHTAGEKFLLYHDFTGVACGSWDTWWWYSCHAGEHFPDYLTVSWLLTKLAVFEFVFYQGDSEILNATYLVVWYSIIKLQWAVALVAVAVQVNRC